MKTIESVVLGFEAQQYANKQALPLYTVMTHIFMAYIRIAYIVAAHQYANDQALPPLLSAWPQSPSRRIEGLGE